MRFEKEALSILNGGRRENKVMILMDVCFRYHGSSISVWCKLALSGFRPWMCSSCYLSMTSMDYSTLLCAAGLVSQDPPQPMSTFPNFRSSL
jgi:hypothetical protein